MERTGILMRKNNGLARCTLGVVVLLLVTTLLTMLRPLAALSVCLLLCGAECARELKRWFAAEPTTISRQRVEELFSQQLEVGSFEFPGYTKSENYYTSGNSRCANLGQGPCLEVWNWGYSYRSFYLLSNSYYRSCRASFYAGYRVVRCGCPPGKYLQASGRRCEDCHAGRFMDVNGAASKSCKECAAGRFQMWRGKDYCSACSINKYSGKGAGYCTRCEAGRFQLSQGSRASCLSCPTGTRVKLSANSYECEACQAGSFNSGEDHITVTLSGCQSCESGTFSARAAASCTACPKGRFQSLSGQSSCHACPEAQFAIHDGQSSCQLCLAPCPTGTRRVVAACGGAKGSTCQPCAAGMFAATKDATTCSVCPKGQFAPQGSSQCTPCEPGRHGRHSGACEYCAVGRFQDESGASVCKSCAEGQYQDQPGRTACEGCEPCAPGFSLQGCAAGTRGRCEACSLGHFKKVTGTFDTLCEECELGRYAADEGLAHDCLLCLQGHFADARASTSCKMCEPGQVQVSAGLDQCTPCIGSKHKFQDLPGKAFCKDCVYDASCGQGQALSGCGGANAGVCSSCKACGNGEYLAGCGAGGSGECRSCAVCGTGEFRQGCDGARPGVCAACPAGKWQDQASAGACKACGACAAGQFSSSCRGSSSGICLSCPLGKFRAKSHGKTSCDACQACNAGFVRIGCSGISGGQCKRCPEWTFKSAGADGSWRDPCNPCTASIACSAGALLQGCGFNDRGACIMCEAGKHQDGHQCKPCGSCPAGKQRVGCSPASSGGFCIACPHDQFKADAGTHECTPCLPCSNAQVRMGCAGESAGSCESNTCSSTGQWANQTVVKASKGLRDGCTACLGCPEGEERNGCGRSSPGSCERCSAGQFKDSGLSVFGGKAWFEVCERCKPCGPGHYRSACGVGSSGRCVPCPVGSFKEERGAADSAESGCTQCSPCGPGNFRFNCGVSTEGLCKPCGAGTFKRGTGHAWSTRCDVCEPCPAGSARTGCGGAVEGLCTPCALGQFKANVGFFDTPCTPCAVCGRGAVRTGCGGGSSGRCVSPLPGFFKDHVGAWNATALPCAACPAGLRRSGCSGAEPGTCEICGEGQFKAKPGSWSTPCEPILGCDAGSFRSASSITTAGVCERCAAGWFKAEQSTWDATCTPCRYCGQRMYSVGCGGASRGQCPRCPAGRYNDVAVANWSSVGAEACKVCPVGSFCLDGDRFGAPLGTFAAAPGSERATNCPAGRFGNVTHASSANCSGACERGFMCPAGSVKADAQACGRASRFCPAGSGIPEEVRLGYYSVGKRGENAYGAEHQVGQRMCEGGYRCPAGIRTPCKIGFRCPPGAVNELPCGSVDVFCTARSANSTPVSVGFFSTPVTVSETQRSSETICPRGFRCEAGRRIACSRGSYQDEAGQASCKSCPAGRFGRDERLETDRCSGDCPSGFYCPARSLTPLRCPADSLSFCPVGASKILSIKPGYFVNKSLGPDRWFMTPCSAGYWCPNDTAFPCPAGHFCPALATMPTPCGGERFFCPALAGKKTSVEGGMWSVGGATELTRTGQHFCGDEGHFCNLGVRRSVKAGFYSAPLSAPTTMRWAEAMCDEGYFCRGGRRIRCTPGSRCIAGSSAEKDCGAPNKFCRNGMEHFVRSGAYSVDANGTDANATRARRVANINCPQGFFCRQGVKRECGDLALYCPGNSTEPVRAPDGFYTGPHDASEKRRFQITPCGCNESAPTKCNSRYYCNGGRRFRIPDMFYALSTAAETFVSTQQRSAILVDKQACDTRAICKEGVSKPCPAGHECVQNKVRCWAAASRGAVRQQCALARNLCALPHFHAAMLPH